MFNRIHRFSALGLLLAFCCAVTCPARVHGQTTASPAPERSRLLLNTQPTGETHFALCLSPSPDTFHRAKDSSHAVDVVVLFDTSASQTGVYRTDATAALRSLLASLATGDRVKLMAIDLDPVDLSAGFVAPTGNEMRAALAKLDRREPLGSTDIAAGLQAAARSFESNSARPRAVVYLGDGMSKANFLLSNEFAAITADLVAARAPVHSYAIGPQRDVQLLAALATHTGGTVYLDAAEAHVAQQAGAGIAAVVHAPVFWPTETLLPASMKEVVPQRTPPLRPDRETVILGLFDGEGPQQIRIRGQVNGAPAEAMWTITPEDSADDLAYLPRLVELAQRDGGATLPTLGMEGLREIGRLMLARAENLTKMGARELAGGNLVGAQKLFEAAKKTDPNNPQAASLEKALRKAAETSTAPTSSDPGPAKGPSPTPAKTPAAKP
jgi:Mg-chelatase subunit ChlD